MIVLIALVSVAGLPVKPRIGLMISRTCHLRPGVYQLTTLEGEKAAGDERIPVLKPAITIRGDGITVDFSGVVLRGTSKDALPDQRKGLCVLVEGKNVTIKNAHIHGYKVGLLARHADGLKVLNSDFSYNWKQHLRSTLDREDLSDWQSYHHNENDEWLRYGAGISLWDCNGFEVRLAKAEGGQCGLMLTRCNHGLVWNNDFSFMSGLGIGMYRSSDNLIMHNRIDWNVRGFSYGVYNRGQDSAGILVFEQCNRNVFAYNSVTHGGDGFFLWAGQETMDTGKGGCNDNVLYGNDFSGAPTNGIEATFSRNLFVNNLVRECWHAVWDGYSYSTGIFDNHFENSEIGIATEHGQNNVIESNAFVGNKVAVQLWANPQQDPTWGYAKNHETQSMQTRMMNNRFSDNGVALSVKDSKETVFDDNVVISSKTALAGDVKPPFTGQTLTYNNNEFSGTELPDGAGESNRSFSRINLDDRQDRDRPWNPWQAPSQMNKMPKPLPGGIDPFLKPGSLRGWKYIIVDEWGPYDFKRPLLWPREEIGKGRRRFEILGPKGRWSLVGASGVSHLSAKGGPVPGFIDVDLPARQAGLTKISLRYTGGETTDFRGNSTPAGRSVLFGYSHFFAPIAWDVKFYRWSESQDPQDPHSVPKDLVAAILLSPIKEVKTDRLDMAGAALVPGLPADHYGTMAVGTFSVETGEYTFDLTTDDGARVWLDGVQLITDAWHYQGPTLYSKTVHLKAGSHRLDVEHFQIDGYAELKLEMKQAG